MSTYRSQGHSLSYMGIDKPSIAYRLVHTYAWLTFRYVYHHRFEVVGIENIPPKGTPLLVVSNHHCGLNDALCILFMFPDGRPAVFVARSDMFRNKAAAFMLRFLKILPAFRTQDGEDPRRNNTTFEVAASVLQNKHTLILFPEGEHHADNWMWPFRRGFARVAFKAEEASHFELGTEILPVGLYYAQHHHMRKDVAIVIGKPVPLAPYLPLYHQSPEKAQLALLRDMQERVAALTLNFDSEHDYLRYNTARLLYEQRQMQRMGLSGRKFYHRLQAGQAIAAQLQDMRHTQPERLEAILSLAMDIDKQLQELKLRSWLLNKPITIRWILPRTLLLAVLSPLYALLWLLNVLPYNAPKLINRKIADPMMHPTVTFAMSVILTFPLFYLTYSIALSSLMGSAWYILPLIVVLIGGLMAFYYYRKAWVKLRGAWRYHTLTRKHDTRLTNLQAQYEELMREMEE